MSTVNYLLQKDSWLNETETFFLFSHRNTDEIKKAIIGANNAIASVRAKPKMA